MKDTLDVTKKNIQDFYFDMIEAINTEQLEPTEAYAFLEQVRKLNEKAVKVVKVMAQAEAIDQKTPVFGGNLVIKKGSSRSKYDNHDDFIMLEKDLKDYKEQCDALAKTQNKTTMIDDSTGEVLESGSVIFNGEFVKGIRVVPSYKTYNKDSLIFEPNDR